MYILPTRWNPLCLSLDVRDRLSASDYLQVRKVCEHVYEKLFICEEMSGSGSRSEDSSSNSRAEKAGEKIEILCQDEVSRDWDRFEEFGYQCACVVVTRPQYGSEDSKVFHMEEWQWLGVALSVETGTGRAGEVGNVGEAGTTQKQDIDTLTA